MSLPIPDTQQTIVNTENIIDKCKRDLRAFIVIFFKLRGYATGIAANGTAAMMVENLNRLRALFSVVDMQIRITNIGRIREKTMKRIIASVVYLCV